MNDLKNIIEDINKSDIVSKKVIKKVIEKIGYEEWQDLYDEYNDTVTTTGEVVITLRNLELENKQLKAQIEKLHNCENCKHFKFNGFHQQNECSKYSCEWELAE